MRFEARESLGAALVYASVILVAGSLGWLLWDVLGQGLPRLSWAYLSQAPEDAGRAGGIAPMLVSTLLILGVCMAVSLPLGLGAALWLSEVCRAGHPLARALRRLLDVLAATPSIVIGLFGNALFSKALGLGFSILAGGLTLACMVLPILIRTTEEAFSAVPPELRSAARALALSQMRTLVQLLLPVALPGLMAGFLLGLGRALAETAALIFTSGYVDRMPESLLDSGRALSVHIYDLAMHVGGGEGAAYAAASTLILLILLINALFLALAGLWRRRALRLVA
ncbi:MAG: phosphate ABC transporter permease PstA [Polycyclovorans sp.]|mgnify:CR=1 FL=1